LNSCICTPVHACMCVYVCVCVEPVETERRIDCWLLISAAFAYEIQPQSPRQTDGRSRWIGKQWMRIWTTRRERITLSQPWIYQRLTAPKTSPTNCFQVITACLRITAVMAFFFLFFFLHTEIFRWRTKEGD